MKKHFLLFTVAVVFLFTAISAQQPSDFKPGGKPEVRIFTNFTSSFTNGKNFNKFDITRAYLGYLYDFSPTIRGRITYDVGNPSVGKNHYAGFLKFAYLQVHSDKLTFYGGMIPSFEYEISDQKWGYRYIMVPLHSEYGFGTPADMGISAEYKFISWFSADLILVNGEGFKLSEGDSTFKAGAGIKLYPVKNLVIRGYFDTMKKNNANQQTAEVLAAYENTRFRLSGAYSYQKDHALVMQNDYGGFTVNGSLFLKNGVTLIGRYDRVESVTIAGASRAWNLSKDGQLFFAGLEFSPVKGVKVAPNYQGWQPADPNKPFISRFSLHIDIRI